MSLLNSTEERLSIVNGFLDVISVLQKYVSRRIGKKQLYKSKFGEIALYIDGYEARVMYCSSDRVIDLISLYHDADIKSEGAAFDSFDFTSAHYLSGMHIHQRNQYQKDMMDSIDEMNNTFSTGYLPEEEHFQYSTLFDLPPYEELGVIFDTMNRCIGDFGFQIRFTQFENLPIPPEQFMKILKEGIAKVC